MCHKFDTTMNNVICGFCLFVFNFYLFIVRFYEGVVELSLTAAEKKDPQGLGLHFYKNGEPEEDVVGLQAFQERQVFILCC